MNARSGPVPGARRWLVSGRVQGVGFRWFVCEEARALGLAGDVRNLEDGRVEVRVSGPADGVEALRERVRQGPPGSRVSGIEERACDGSGFDGFHVRR